MKTLSSRLFLLFLLVPVCLSALFGPVTQEVRSQDSLSIQSPSVAMGEPTAKSLDEFRKVLISNAVQQFKDGEINRAQLLRIRLFSKHEPTLVKIHQACAEQVLEDGKAISYGAIDWTKLAAFIKEMIPIILELIKLFADSGHGWNASSLCYHQPIPIGYQWHSEYHLAA